MTRKEAKEILLNAAWFGTNEDREKTEEAVKMAVKALEEKKSPCDLCRHNPPSSVDGKPCCMCPAESV